MKMCGNLGQPRQTRESRKRRSKKHWGDQLSQREKAKMKCYDESKCLSICHEIFYSTLALSCDRAETRKREAIQANKSYYLPHLYVYIYIFCVGDYSFEDLTFIISLFNYKYSICYFSWVQIPDRMKI